MKRDARILLIDDNPDDRSLVRLELTRAMEGLDLRETNSLPELEEMLAKDGADLVITDFQLHGANGLEVLRKVKSLRPGLPVIMFTGTGSEEIAVEAMKSGLDDYVLKTSRTGEGRLRAAVQKALKMGQKQRELQEAESRFKTLFDTVPVGLFRCTPAGVILDANPALVSILGFEDRAGLVNATFPELHADPGEFARWREILERHGSVGFIEARFRGSGGFKWVQIHAKAFREPGTGQICYEGSVEDITEQKQAEAEREMLISQLQDALAKVKMLTGLLPICASCKKIREDDGNWNQIELYIQNHSEAQFTHGFCPDCVKRLYPEVFVDTPRL